MSNAPEKCLYLESLISEHEQYLQDKMKGNKPDHLTDEQWNIFKKNGEALLNSKNHSK